MNRDNFCQTRLAKQDHWKCTVHRFGNPTLDHIDLDLRMLYLPFFKRKRVTFLVQKTYRKQHILKL